MTPDDPRPPQSEPEDSGAPSTPSTSSTPGASDEVTSGARQPVDPTPVSSSGSVAAGSPAPDVQADEVDQLASEMLDGDLGLDDPARLRPDVVARAAELDTARTTVRDVPAADPVARERALAAALAAFDEEAPAASSSTGRPPPPPSVHGRGPAPAPPPVDLAEHRRARPGRAHAGRKGLPRWFGAAAAAVVVLAGLVGLAALTSSGSDDADTAMDAGTDETQASGGDDAGTATEDSAEAPSASEPGVNESQRAPVEAGDLGIFATGDALVDHVRDTVGNGEGGMELEPGTGDPPDADTNALGTFATCDGAPPPPLDDPGAAVALHGRAVVGDEAADVWVIDTERGRRIVAIDAACELVLDRPMR